MSEPDDIKTKSGSFFKVFTPFWNTNFEVLVNQKLNISSPKKFNFYNKSINNNLKIHELKLNIPRKEWMNKILFYWNIGEKSAELKLKNFINDGFKFWIFKWTMSCSL